MEAKSLVRVGTKCPEPSSAQGFWRSFWRKTLNFARGFWKKTALTSSQECGEGDTAGRPRRDVSRQWLKPQPGTGAAGQHRSPGQAGTEGAAPGTIPLGCKSPVAGICVHLGAGPAPGRSTHCSNKSSLRCLTAAGSAAASPRLFKTLPKKVWHLLLLLLSRRPLERLIRSDAVSGLFSNILLLCFLSPSSPSAPRLHPQRGLGPVLVTKCCHPLDFGGPRCQGLPWNVLLGAGGSGRSRGSGGAAVLVT